MFRGINSVNLDEKGRISIPKRYRDVIASDYDGQLIVTIDTESPCLLLYPLNHWQEIENKLQALPSFDASARRIQRLLMGHATDCEMDGSGRLLLPQLLRDYASLQKGIMLVGQGKKFEIWDEQTWQEHREQWLSHTIESHDKAIQLPDLMREISL